MTLYLQGEGDRGYEMNNFTSDLVKRIPYPTLLDLHIELEDLNYSPLEIQWIYAGFCFGDELSWSMIPPHIFGLEFNLERQIELPEILFKIDGLKRFTISLPGAKTPLFYCHKFEISSLEELTINNTYLERVPEGVFQLPNLEKLDLSGNAIKVVRSQVTIADSKLTKMDLSNNMLAELPLLYLKKLKYLNISDNYISDLRHLENYENLEILKASGNYIHELHREMFNIPKLKDLHLQNNFIMVLPIELDENRVVEFLDLSNNYISYLPYSFFNLQGLKYLYLSKNDIPTLTYRISLLPSLRVLDVSHNKIRYLPDLHNLKSLMKLKLDDNQLIEIPRLPELEELSYTQDYIDNELFTAISMFYSCLEDNEYVGVCN